MSCVKVSSMKGYKKLRVWEEAHKLVISVYTITKKYPREELFGLVSQMRRAVVSIIANIIEGQARTKKEFLHFLVIANGSLVELEYYLELSLDLNFLTRSDFEELERQKEAVGGLLTGLIRSLKS